MGAFEDAIAAIRGPSLDDLLAEYPPPEAPPTGDAVSSSTTLTPATPYRAPRRGSVTETATTGPVQSLAQSTPGPAVTPSSLNPPPQKGPGLAESFMEDVLDPLVTEPVLRHRGAVAQGARIAGALGGGLAGSVAGVGPRAGAIAGAALVEPGAAALEGGESLARGALNVGVAGLGGEFSGAANQFVRPVLRVGTQLVEASGLSELYSVARGLLDEGKVDWHEVSQAGGSPVNLVALPFGVAEAVKVNHEMRALREKQATLPDEIVRTHAETGGATYDSLGHNRIEDDSHSVGLYPERTETIQGDLTPGHVAGFITRNRDLIDRDPRNMIGTWWDRDAGAHVLDVIGDIKDADTAKSLGEKYGQKAIFHRKSMSEIATGGDGTAPEGMPPIYDRLPSRKTDFLHANLGVAATDAREKMAKWYARSGLSDERGAINLDLLVPGATSLRPRVKKTLTPEDQAVRFNLSRIAADDITAHEGQTTYEEWAARMLDTYGPTMARHVRPAWKSAEIALNNRAHSMFGDKLPDFTKTAELLNAGRDAEAFYGPAHEQLTKVFGKDTDTFLDFYAASSPRLKTSENLQQALRWYVQWKAGNTEFRGGLYPDWAAKIAKDDPNWGGPKVRAFRANLGGRGHPAGANTSRVTIDTWMLRYLGYKPDVRTGELGMATGQVGDLEYAINEDFLRAQAGQAKMDPEKFQETIWAGTRNTWPDQRDYGEGLGPHTIIQRRWQDGLSIFDTNTMSALTAHEEAVAKVIDAEMIAGGRATHTAEGLGGAEGAFDWSTGQTVPARPALREIEGGQSGWGGEDIGERAPARLRAVRAGEAGATKLDALLPIWATIQVAKGVNKFARFSLDAAKRWGNSVRKWLPAAWAEGKRRAFTMARRQVDVPEPPRREFSEGRMPESQRAREKSGFEVKYGPAGKVMTDLLERYAPEIEEQRRGVVHDEDLQKAADQIRSDMVGLVQKFKPGSAATDAEIKNIADLSYTLDKRLAAKLKDQIEKETAGTWTEADDADLSELEQNYVNLHTVRAGTSAEAGRALRAHQVTARLRNRNLDALIGFAKARGLDHDQIKQIFATHKDQLSRAQAVQAMTKLTLPKLYTHARYWTMLADPSTWINAGLGNTVDGLVREFGKVPALAHEKLFHRGSQSLYSRDFNPRTAGAIRGMGKGFRRWYHVMTEGVTAESIASGKVPPEELFAGSKVGGLVANLPFRALSASDALATTMFGESEMNGFAYARAMKMARDRKLSGRTAEDFATQKASEWVAAQPEWLLMHTKRVTEQLSLQSPLGKTMAKVESALRDYPNLSSFVLAFMRTGVNVLKEAGKKTPAGFAYSRRLEKAAGSFENAREMAKRRSIRVGDVATMEESGGVGTFQASLQREAALTRAESYAGTSAIAASLLLVRAGLGDITGDPPSDTAERERLSKERPFNGVRVGNVWFDQRMFGSLEPILRSVGNAKQAYDLIKRRKVEGVDESLVRANEALWSTVKGLGAEGPLRNLDGFLSLFDGNADASPARAGRIFRDVLLLPTVAEKVQKYVDPYQRRVEGFFDPLVASFAPERVAPRLDPMGDPVPRRAPLGVQIGSRPDDLLNEAAKAGVAVTSPNVKTLRIGNEERQLDLHDRRVLNRALGMASRAALQRLVGNRAQWANIPLEGRRVALTRLRDRLHTAVQSIAISEASRGAPLDIQSLTRPLAGLLDGASP